MLINGKEIAQKILDELKLEIQKLDKVPHLAIILIGNDPASKAYVNQKKIKAEAVGIKTTIFNLESRIQNSELLALINKSNDDNLIHGIIVQQPLPLHLSLKSITNAIDPKKDVDGFHPESKFEPPISLAVFAILQSLNVSFERKNIVVIGKGETGGQPVIQAFKKLGINLTIIDSETKNPETLTKTADIIISAVGKPQVIKPNMIKKGVVLISIGLHKGLDGKLHGDYEESEIKNIASFYTPTPGGVGPVNVAMLLKNLVKATK